MVHVQAIGFDILEDSILYHFNILFDHHNWIISKTYDDFVCLHEDMEDVYSAEQMPYLTGDVRPWARLSKSTGTSRLPKLESYLCEATATDFHPHIFNVTVPLANNTTTRISKFLFDFLNFADHCSSRKTPIDGDLLDVGSTGVGPQVSNTDNINGKEGAANGDNSITICGDNTSAAMLLPLEDNETQKRKHEIMKLEEYTKVSKMAIERSEAGLSSTVTNQIKIFIESFNISTKERDYEEYVVMVIIWGITWKVTKRYIDFTTIHNEMAAFYGVDLVPSIEGSKIAFFKKIDDGIARMRQEFLNELFETIVRNIDNWEPKGYVVEFVIDDVESSQDQITQTSENDEEKKPKKSSILVTFNKFIFEFFELQEHLRKVDAKAVQQALQLQINDLPDCVKQAMKYQQEAITRLKVMKELDNRMESRRRVSDQDITDLITYTSRIKEDRDILNVIHHFCLTGMICRDINYLDKKYEVHQKDDFTAKLRSISKDFKNKLDREAEEEKAKHQEKNGRKNQANMKSSAQYDRPIIVRRPKKGKADQVAINMQNSSPSYASYSMMSTAMFDSYSYAHDEFDDIDDITGLVSLSGHTGDPTINTIFNQKPHQLDSQSSVSLCNSDQFECNASSNINRSDVDSGGGIIAMTSAQAAIVAKSIYFNDTRILAIKLMSISLCDDTKFDELFGTLIYFWDETKADVIKRISSAGD